jgi:hypothetical protein
MRPRAARLRVRDAIPPAKEATMSEVPHQAPHPRGDQLVEKIEDAAILLALFSVAAIIAAILLLFIVL